MDAGSSTCGLWVRGRTAPADQPPDGASASLVWLELRPDKVVAWDYGRLREVADNGPDDPRVRRLPDRSMTMRGATLSASGVPHLTPLRFIYDGRAVYALTRATSPTVRHIRQRPGVVLLDAEQPTGPVLRVRAQAAVQGEPRAAGVVGAARRGQVLPAARWHLEHAGPLAPPSGVDARPPQRDAGRYRADPVRANDRRIHP